MSFSIRLFITHYSSFRRRICLPFKYSFFVTCCPVKFLIQSVITSLKCSIVSSSIYPSFINHCLSITFLIDIQLASTPLWEAEESCGIYSKEMYLVESCNCICSIKSSLSCYAPLSAPCWVWEGEKFFWQCINLLGRATSRTVRLEKNGFYQYLKLVVWNP